MSVTLTIGPSADADVLGSSVAATDDAQAWQNSALCRQIDSGDLFFPEKGGSALEAKRICLACDVRAECLDYALTNDERFGVYGGTTPAERDKLQRAAYEQAR